MPASTGVDLAARLCCYPGQHSAPSVGWAQGVRKIPKHDDWLCALSGKIPANETRRGVDCVGWRALRGQTAVIVQEDRFEATSSITLCAFTTDQTDAPLLRMLIEPTDRNGLSSASRLMIDKIYNRTEGPARQADRQT